MVKAIVGANWGDEGKGKITDMFAEASDVAACPPLISLSPSARSF